MKLFYYARETWRSHFEDETTCLMFSVTEIFVWGYVLLVLLLLFTVIRTELWINKGQKKMHSFLLIIMIAELAYILTLREIWILTNVEIIFIFFSIIYLLLSLRPGEQDLCTVKCGERRESLSPAYTLLMSKSPLGDVWLMA